MALLELKGVTKQFGGILAVDRIDMQIFEQEILGLIGPNGAGKTTVFNCICGRYHCTNGEILLQGEQISKLKSHEIAKKGIARTFQTTILLNNMSVLDNIIIGSHTWGEKSLALSFTNRRKYLRAKERAGDILRAFGMDKVSHMAAGELPHGQQRLTQIAIAVASEPKLLLLDEPVVGMNAEEIRYTMEAVKKLREQGITILLVEHNMRAVMEYCERIVVLDHGRKIAEDSPDKVRSNEDVIRAYLGAPEHFTED